jgi:hypothetical protein
MSVPKFKRLPSGLDYVDNAYELQKEIMTLASKLSARWARILGQPIDNLVCKQADFVNMACSINCQNIEDYITRRWLLKMSRACLQALEKRLMDMVRILYMNPVKCFSRRNGKRYSNKDATKMLDGRLEVLGTMFDKQYSLIKGVLDSDNKKLKRASCDDISDEEIIKILISKYFQMIFE